MDLFIKPFWIVIAFVYLGLAVFHYNLQRFLLPISGKWIAAAESVGDNNAGLALRLINYATDTTKRVLKYSSYAFLIAGTISLLQGLLDIENIVSLNLIFILIFIFLYMFIIGLTLTGKDLVVRNKIKSFLRAKRK